MEIAVLRNIFAKNEKAAEQNRRRLDELGVTAFNLLGGAGCGKTTILERVIPMLRDRYRVAVLEGDIATTRDAERIARTGAPVVQLLTEGGCHLTPTIVQHGLERLPLASIDLLLIENVGNPICPANFDLGEHAKMCVLSVTEGDDKPEKYPLLFKVADLVIIAKTDLTGMCNFDINLAESRIRAVNPDVKIVHTGLKDCQGIEQICQWIVEEKMGAGRAIPVAAH